LRNLIGQMFRFGMVGVVNAGVDTAVFFTMVGRPSPSIRTGS
jgi:putative flippase GtrA